MIKRFELPYAGRTQEVLIPDGNFLCCVQPKILPHADGAQILEHALARPLLSPTLDNFLEGAKDIVVIVNDATRPTPTSMILKRIFPHLGGKSVRYLVATGSHRAPTDTEYRMIFGDIYSQIQPVVYSHDARESKTVLLGTSRHGTPLRINRMVVDADRIIAISSVEPHYFAGFTGGRKSFLPGVAALEAIEANHKMAMREEVSALRLEGNPVHEDMTDLMGLLEKKPVFSIQAVLDAKRRTVAMFAGDLEQSFRAATRVAEEVFVVRLERQADVVVAVAEPPLDINFYQITKAVETARNAVRNGGALILVGACPEGIGTSTWVELLAESQTLEHCIERVNNSYKLSYHKAARIWKLGLRYKLIAVTSLAPDIVRQAHFTPADTIQGGLDLAMSALGADAKVAILLDAVHVVPVIEPAAAKATPV